MTASAYRGSPKHKDRPGRGRKGTLCPEWTHATAKGGYAGNPARYAWEKTLAHTMFQQSEPDPEGSDKRYATMRGMAFVAVRTNDGSWHGYPEPWTKVPAVLKEKWQDEGKVGKKALKTYKEFPKDNIGWALDSDDE